MDEVDYTYHCAHVHKQSNIFLATRLKQLGLNVGQFPHLMCVCSNPGLTQDQIALKTKTDKSTVAKMVKQLVDAGFLTRKDNTEDKRSYFVFPTQKALDAYPEIAAEKRKWHAILTSNFTDTERKIFDLLLVKLKI
ncbi:MAG: MarR family transcriptional regulator [Planctomycetes bacterium]|nr:MarR family transcriptional regulator [Planctomycetota bacterium]